VADYYIDYDSGDDTNNGTSDATPWKHHPWDTNATDTADGTTLAAGDICYFKKGVTYVGALPAEDSGSEKESGTDGVVSASGLVFTSDTATFQTNSVQAGDYIYINGEGVVEISVVDSETQLTLSSACVFKNRTSVPYLIMNPIKLTISDSWGSGTAKIQGQITTTSREYIWIEGNSSNELQLTKTNGYGIYANNGSVLTGFVFKDFDIYDTDSDDQAGIYLRNVKYTLIDGVEISYVGDIDATLGDDGITTATSAQYTTVQACEIHHNGDDGIHMAPAQDSYIQFCTIHHPAPDAGDVHPDAIATSHTSNFDLTIRFNTIYDCRNPTDLEHLNLEMYGNIIYDTSVGSPGNHAIRTKLGVTGKIYNNIIAWNNYAIYSYDTSGALDIQNNIFWENGDQNAGQELRLNDGDTCKYNIYHRIDLLPTDDVVNYNGTNYTLDEFKAANLGPGNDNGTGSLARTPNITDYTAQVFTDETRGSQDFTPHSSSSPQVGSGADLGSPYDMDILKVTRPQGVGWDIGAYEDDLAAPPEEGGVGPFAGIGDLVMIL